LAKTQTSGASQSLFTAHASASPTGLALELLQLDTATPMTSPAAALAKNRLDTEAREGSGRAACILSPA